MFDNDDHDDDDDNSNNNDDDDDDNSEADIKNEISRPRLSRGFRNLEHCRETNRHTDRRD